MFLLNSFCNKYFAMNTSFRISLLFLLLIIPQHGNSPLPVMETWLQKDQDDGFVQRDMTSSLTGGDESFDSAHQTYQNSLIRKKKSENKGNPFPAGWRKFAAKYDTNQRYEEPKVLFNNRVDNDDYNADADDNGKVEAIFEEFDSPSGLPSDKYRNRLSLNNPNNENLEPQFMNEFNNDKYSDVVPSKDLYNRMAYMRNNRERSGGLSPFENDLGDVGKRSMCKRLKARYAMNPLLGVPRSFAVVENREGSNFPDSLALQDNYFRMGDGRSHEINNERFKDDVQLSERLGGRNPQILQENNEYYDADTNPFDGEEDLNVEDEDYHQMSNDHSYIHKRDDTKQSMIPKSGTGNQQSETAEIVLDSLKGREPSRSLNDAISVEEMKKDLGRAREAENANFNFPHSDSVWQLNRDPDARALNNVLRDSQRALRKVQMFQQRLALKSQDGGDKEGTQRGIRSQALWDAGKRNSFFDENRLKREDEDEQKNMKTGTDEGGGGEYEDEEGKGHKDEEEYYEDADLSNDETDSKVQTTADLNQKYVKREITQDINLNNQNEEQNDDNSEDYELNLENAPVENSEKSRKNSLHGGEGEKAKNNSARKGVKIWDQWGKWSPCSVTCGVGRCTRWRHCIGGGCAQGEKEAQIKRCTNPAC